MKFRLVVLFVIALPSFAVNGATAQDQTHPANGLASLADLASEAERNNPQILAARHAWESAKHVPSQVSTLPDPQIFLQHVSVGSPRPFAGFTNSDFAYVGLGVSQDLPYPGKLRLRGEVARKDADVMQARYEAVRRAILAQVKTAYFQAAYLAKRRDILEQNGLLLNQVEQSAQARYRSGMENQQGVLQAQLEQTKLLREITGNEFEAERVQSELKQLLNRSQTSPDIQVADLSENNPPYTYDQLLAAANANNPELAAAQRTVERQKLQVDLAKKDFYPDFNVQYAWQRTDPTQFRAYYMLTFGVRLPIYRSRRQQPELAQAQAEQSRAKSEQETQSQEVAFRLRQQYLSAERSGKLLKIYREGLVPQAHAELQAGMAAYQSNRQDFQALLASFLDVLKLDEEYWQALSEHQMALGQMEEITGLTLR